MKRNVYYKQGIADIWYIIKTYEKQKAYNCFKWNVTIYNKKIYKLYTINFKDEQINGNTVCM